MKQEQFAIEPEIKENFIATLNQMGYMFIKPDSYMQAFIDLAAESGGPVLDIGAAYGITTIPALEKGAFVVANDLDERHLNILKSKVSPSLLGNLELKQGKMPSDLDFSENYFSAILASRILNFIEPELLRYSFSLIYKWLKPGGKFFYLGATPYMGTFKMFLPQYKQNKLNKKEWPGLIENIPTYAPHRTKHLPLFINLIDEEMLIKLMDETGFKVEKMGFIPAEEAHPEDMKLDGREHLGAIAVKP